MTIETATVVTPCLNAQHLIRRTVESIMGQTAVRSGRLKLQYLVCDGGSTDGTLDIIREVCGDRAVVRSEPDSGMYQALARGLEKASGQIVGYLNAGDVYASGALEIVAEVMEATNASWITGKTVVLDELGRVLEQITPYRYRRELIRKGLYGTRLLPFFIQQESTFWNRSLHAELDLAQLARFQLAGDYYLWSRYARVTELLIADVHLGAFTIHRGQKSEARQAYWREVASFAEPVRFADALLALLDRTLWHLAPRSLKKRLSRGRLLDYSRRD